MSEKIDHKHPEFEGLRAVYDYPRTVQYFERDEQGHMKVVFWNGEVLDHPATMRPPIYA